MISSSDDKLLLDPVELKMVKSFVHSEFNRVKLSTVDFFFSSQIYSNPLPSSPRKGSIL